MRFLALVTIILVVGTTQAFENGFLRAFTDGVDILIDESIGKVETYEHVRFNYTISCNKSLELIKWSKNGGDLLKSSGNLTQNGGGLTTRGVKTRPSKIMVKLHINDTDIAWVETRNISEYIHLDCLKGNEEVVRITAGHLGITRLTLEMKDQDSLLSVQDVQIRIKRKVTLFDVLSFYILGPLILLNKCAFGAKIEVQTLIHICTQPVALFLCLTMQFIAMPLLAFMYGTMFGLNQALALALFVGAACPGGGGGYVFSYLINGDVTLAISASLLSTLVAMGAMPAVIGLYAYLMNIPDTIAIPYSKMIMILFVIAIPISTGMVINRKWPNFAKKFVKIIRPLSLFLIFCGFAFLAVTSKYIIHGPKIGWALAFILPSSGFILSVLVARCFGQSWPFAKAISLESGMKNTLLGIAVIELTYPQPEADLSSILIVMVTLGHTTLCMLWYFAFLIREKCCASHDRGTEFMKLENIDDDDEEESEIDEAMTLKG